MSHADDGQLNALLDGELTAAETTEVESHVASCAECRTRLEEARRFLAEAGELLGMLDLPVVAAEPRRVSKTAKEVALDVGAPRVSRTVKEKAVDIDARTVKSPALPPVFSRQAERGVPERRPRPRIGQLAWAAMVVLALGVGYLANEVRNRGRVPQNLALAPTAPPAALAERASETAKTPAGVPAVAAPLTRPGAVGGPEAQPAAGRATTGPAAGAGAVRARLIKPAGARGRKPSSEEAARMIPRERPPGALARRPAAQPSSALVGVPGAVAAGGAADVLAAAPPSSAAAARAGPAPAAAAGPAVTRADAGARGAAGAPVAPAAPSTTAARAAPAPAAAVRARAAEPAVSEEPPRAFRRVTMDEAVRRLTGAIRLIDGMQPVRVEVGPGRLVPGSAADREVVRVYYTDEAGRQLILDQQPGETAAPGGPAPSSVNGLMRGDTLVTSSPSGGNRVRWVDRRNFWLSLTGHMSPDSLRAILERIR